MSRKFTSSQRYEIWDRDEGFCGLCGKRARWNNWEADHIWPWSQGGETTVENGQVAHPWCNREKQATLSCSGSW